MTLVILATRIIEDIVGAAMNHCEDDTGGPAQCARSIGHIKYSGVAMVHFSFGNTLGIRLRLMAQQQFF